MQIEAIGLVALGLGLLGWMVGPRLSIPIIFTSTLLGASAAIILNWVGDANIQPAHLLLGFLLVAALTNRDALHAVPSALAFPRAGFWLLLTGGYAAISAVIFPRLFAGATYVFAIARTEIGPGIVSMPLTPTSGNITQTVYFFGDIACFLVFYAYACKPVGVKAIAYAAIAATAVNLAFAAIDLTGYWINAGDLLAFLRNGSYRMLDDAMVLGFKRIVGSFPEASTFAYFTLGFFAFCTKLWLDGIKARFTGPLALLSLLALAFSTSSTGYAGMVGFLAALWIASLARTLRGAAPRATLVSVAAAPLVVTILLIGARLNQPAWQMLEAIVNQTVVDKLATQSGIERAKWNAQALINFSDTGWLGGGVGSVRASSFPVAVLGNIGAIGAATYGSFLFGLLFRRKNRWAAPFPAACQSGARWACLTQLVGASVSGSFIDLGLPFYIFAGLACAGPAPGRSAQPAPASRPLAPALG